MRRLLVGLAIVSIAALSPCWVHADDQQIAQQVVQQLRQHKADGKLAGFGIDLEVDSGIVWLKGHVASKEQQTIVLDIARHVDGVQQVVNDLQIKSTAKPTTKARKAVTKPVKSVTTARHKTPAKQQKSSLLSKSKHLLASFNQGVSNAFRRKSTTKTHTAKTTTRREPRVVTVAKSTKAVETQVAKPAPTPATTEIGQALVKATTVSMAKKQRADAEIAQDVIGQLRTKKQSGSLRDFDIDVQVSNAVVWISGRTASSEQQALVLDVARRVSGVKQVVNDLRVQSAAPVRVASMPLEAPQAATAPEQAKPIMVAARPTPAPVPVAVAPQPVTAPARPVAFAPARSVAYQQGPVVMGQQPVAAVPAAAGIARARFDHPQMPGYAWPSYAAYPNYGAVTYPRQYSPTAWPYIGPFYPYPQVPLGWRKVTLEWDDGWWMLDFKSK